MAQISLQMLTLLRNTSNVTSDTSVGLSVVDRELRRSADEFIHQKMACVYPITYLNFKFQNFKFQIRRNHSSN